MRVACRPQAENPAGVGGGIASEASARTAWHTHPVGQVLIVTPGIGWMQREGGPGQEIRPGDGVWIAPGVKHWHDAAATTGMTHIVPQGHVDGRVAGWMEKATDGHTAGDPLMSEGTGRGWRPARDPAATPSARSKEDWPGAEVGGSGR